MATTQTFTVLYFIFICILGIVFSIADTFIRAYFKDHYYIPGIVFRVYMGLVALIAMLYLHLDIYRRASHRRDPISQPNSQFQLTTISRADSKPDGDQPTEQDERHAFYPEVAYGYQHVISLYPKCGLVAFNIVGMIMFGFRLVSPFEQLKQNWTWKDIIDTINNFVTILIILLQSFQVFKYSNIYVNRRVKLVRFALIHLIAYNVTLWCSITTHETLEAMSNENHHTRMISGRLLKNDTTEDESLSNGATLATNASPYLYPCVVEYCIICAAIQYKMLLNVSKPLPDSDDQIGENPQKPYTDIFCHRANRGLFLGLVVLSITVISIAMFFVFENYKTSDGTEYYVSMLLFLTTQFFLLSVSTIAVFCALKATSKLSHTGTSPDLFDDTLLLIGQAGYFTGEIFNLLGAIDIVTFHSTIDGPHCAYLMLPLFKMLQTFLQTHFIICAFGRSAMSDSDRHEKPGRSFITFLLIANVALWAVLTFEVRESTVMALNVQRNQHRIFPWMVASYITLPMGIFYRFHSTVCLAEIWYSLYDLRRKHVE
ncbi:proton channel OtopLc-like [Tubulanus polymorphus]|uniref:proton channel OtopLc-like n=1 Tax=Tubulanus polymorphus TaxID=672921 RepID=UPI003DA2F648